jgi:hypothetical protein
MASTLFMGGIFNTVDPITNFITLYMWSWLALLIFIGLAWAGMYFRGWKPLAPLHGLYYAMKNYSNVAFIFDSFLVGELVAEREAKCIFDYSKEEHGEEYEIDIPDGRFDNFPPMLKLKTWYHTNAFYYPTKYLKNIDPVHAIIYKIGGVNKDVEIARFLEGGKWDQSASVVCAGVPVDIVVDMDKWTIKGTKQHEAVVRAARRWNDNHPKDQIHSYQKFQTYVMNNEIACPPEIQITSLVPWQRIDAAFPLDLDENEWAGKKWQKSKDEEESEGGSIYKLAMYILLAGLGVDVLMFLGRLALKLTGK